MSSRPFFYNVLKADDGKIYAGTSEGIFLFEAADMSKINDRIGYLMLDNSGKPVIDPNGIKYHDQKTYHRLLPFPTASRDEYHAGTDEFFYITSGGKMHIYEILPFEIRYRNHSVRPTSKNFIGTYSGIYYHGQKLTWANSFPTFSDGHIREMNGKAFICYSSLLIADMRGGDSIPLCRLNMPKGFTFDWATDIFYSAYYKQYFVSAKTDLVNINSDLTIAKSVYKTKGKDAEIVLLGEDRGSVYFASGNAFMMYKPKQNKSSMITRLPEPILAGHINNLNNYLLCSRGLYVVHADGNLEQLTELNKAHSIQHLGGSDYAIATDAGLFRYDVATNKLSELIRGVEFNRYGLYKEGDSLFAGSIDGLYVLNAKNLDQLAERISKTLGAKEPLSAGLIVLLGLLIVSAAVLAILLYVSRKRISRIKEETQVSIPPKTNREDIEHFIRENLAQASLKSIAERFDTNNAVIYELLSPEKPGALINRLRMEQVKQLRKANKSAKEISQITGFSEYYVRKVWNKKVG
jgi:ligand-binding sensor domain-containing protein